jgi:hypothetical protein
VGEGAGWRGGGRGGGAGAGWRGWGKQVWQQGLPAFKGQLGANAGSAQATGGSEAPGAGAGPSSTQPSLLLAVTSHQPVPRARVHAFFPSPARALPPPALQEGFTEDVSLPLAEMPLNAAGQCWTVLRIAGGLGAMPSGKLGCVLRFMVKEIDPTTGETEEDGYEDEYQVGAWLWVPCCGHLVMGALGSAVRPHHGATAILGAPPLLYPRRPSCRPAAGGPGCVCSRLREGAAGAHLGGRRGSAAAAQRQRSGSAAAWREEGSKSEPRTGPCACAVGPARVRSLIAICTRGP